MAADGRGGGTAVDDEVMALRLAADRLVDRGVERVVARVGPDDGAQIGDIVLPEAQIQLAGCRQPDAVAAFTENYGVSGVMKPSRWPVSAMRT